MIKVFCDTSVLLASLRSPRGGASELLRSAVVEVVAAFLSDDGIEEVARHVHEVGPDLRALFLTHLATIPFTTVSVPADEVQWAASFTAAKDSPLVAAAKLAGVDYLVTVDKRHLLDKKAQIEPNVGFDIVRPGDLLALLREDG